VSRVQIVVENDSAAQQATSSVEASGLKVLSSYRQQTTLEEVFVALVGRGFREREHEHAS